MKIEDIIVASDSIVFQARFALYFLAVWTIIRTPPALYNHGLMATQNMAAANIIGLIGNMIRLLLSLLFVYTGFALVGLIAANIFAEDLTFVMQLKYFRSKYPDFLFGWRVSNTKLFMEIFIFGAGYWRVNIATVLSLGSDS